MQNTAGMSTLPATATPSIAIVGGGIAGLMLALHLLKLSRAPGTPQHARRYAVTVYEAMQAMSEMGAGVSFGPNAVLAMRCIGHDVYAAFEDTETHNQSPAKQDVWFDFRFGESVGGRYHVDADADADLITSVRCAGGQCGVRRSEFLARLVRLLPDGVAVFDKRVTHYTEQPPDDRGGGKVTLHFQDGTAAAHDAVIGCDGIKSSIRRTLLAAADAADAADAVFSGKFCYRGLIPMSEAVATLGPDRARNAQMYLGRHGHILTFAVEKGRLMNVVAFGSNDHWADERWVVEADPARLQGAFAGWSTATRRIVGMMREADVWALFNHRPAPTYVSSPSPAAGRGGGGGGRVCLVGDAAHATTPHKGAGAGMAIEDVYVLGHLLAAALAEPGPAAGAHAAIAAAFAVYDASRRPRTLRLVEDSRETGILYDLEHPAFGDDRDKLRETLLRRMDWVWDHDVRVELATALNQLKTRLAGGCPGP